MSEYVYEFDGKVLRAPSAPMLVSLAREFDPSLQPGFNPHCNAGEPDAKVALQELDMICTMLETGHRTHRDGMDVVVIEDAAAREMGAFLRTLPVAYTVKES